MKVTTSADNVIDNGFDDTVLALDFVDFRLKQGDGGAGLGNVRYIHSNSACDGAPLFRSTDRDVHFIADTRVSANSVIHYHTNIHKALKYAVKIDLIPSNPADKIPPFSLTAAAWSA